MSTSLPRWLNILWLKKANERRFQRNYTTFGGGRIAYSRSTTKVHIHSFFSYLIFTSCMVDGIVFFFIHSLIAIIVSSAIQLQRLGTSGKKNGRFYSWRRFLGLLRGHRFKPIQNQTDRHTSRRRHYCSYVVVSFSWGCLNFLAFVSSNQETERAKVKAYLFSVWNIEAFAMERFWAAVKLGLTLAHLSNYVSFPARREGSCRLTSVCSCSCHPASPEKKARSQWQLLPQRLSTFVDIVSDVVSKNYSIALKWRE